MSTYLSGFIGQEASGQGSGLGSNLWWAVSAVAVASLNPSRV